MLDRPDPARYTHRAAASALSSGLVLKAIAAGWIDGFLVPLNQTLSIGETALLFGVTGEKRRCY
jgi:hypothetical protein